MTQSEPAEAQRIAGLEQIPVLIIPGIAGHPLFHEGFLAGLHDEYDIYTAAHVDFFAGPCFEWERHVDHWLEQFNRAMTKHRGSSRLPSIVGISFGAHLARALQLRLPPGAVGSVVLISYWHLTRPQRWLLGRLRMSPRAAAWAVGKALFRWSDLHSANVDQLRQLRNELYDDESLVHRRLVARLVSLSDAPPAPRVPSANSHLVFARKDWAQRSMRGQLGENLRRKAVVVEGDHSISLHGSAQLANVLRELVDATQTTTHVDSLALTPGLDHKEDKDEMA